MKTQLQQLVMTASGRHQIVILSYDALRVHGGHLKMGKGVDLLVADEAHVLAGGGARAMALRGVPARSRILMTGTPLSNNLKELFMVYDLARPGCWAPMSSLGRTLTSPSRLPRSVCRRTVILRKVVSGCVV